VLAAHWSSIGGVGRRVRGAGGDVGGGDDLVGVVDDGLGVVGPWTYAPVLFFMIRDCGSVKLACAFGFGRSRSAAACPASVTFCFSATPVRS